MKLELKEYRVDSEADIEESGVTKVLAFITIIANLIGDNNSVEVNIPIQVTSLNSDTGNDMDTQRLTACENLLNNF